MQRTQDLDTPVNVDYATTDGTATNGFKYTAVSGTLAFGAGETNQTIVPVNISPSCSRSTRASNSRG